MSVFAALVAKAHEAGLPFLVIGGNAVIAYGYPRQTQDFDLLVSSRDRYTWDGLMRGMEYYPWDAKVSFHLYKSGAPNSPPIDLMLVDPPTFAKFQSGAKEASVEGVTVPIPKLMHLLALKLHAEKSGGERRAGRDINDVIQLMQLHHIKLEAPEFQEIVNRYGSEAIQQRLAAVLNAPLGPGLRPPGGSS